MNTFLSYFLPDPKVAAQEAIINQRKHLALLEKKEEHCQRIIKSEFKKAKANSVGNKSGESWSYQGCRCEPYTSNCAAAIAALRRKKTYETELSRLLNTKDQLEKQLMTLESASLNMETIRTMKKAALATERLHGSGVVENVERTMEDIQNQRDNVREIEEIISQPLGLGYDTLDEVWTNVLFMCVITHCIQGELLAELEGMHEEKEKDRTELRCGLYISLLGYKKLMKF